MGVTPVNGELINELRTLSESGKIPASARDRLMLAAIATLLEAQKETDKRLKQLEDKSIVMWIERNPALTVFLGSIALVVLSVWEQYGPFVLHAVGVGVFP